MKPKLLMLLDQTIADYCARTGDSRDDLCALAEIGASTLRCYESDHRPLPASAVVAISRATGDMRMLDHMRDACGPQVQPVGTMTQVAGLAGQMAECTGGLIQQIFADVADGCIDDRELKQLRHALGRLHDLLHRIETTAEGANNVKPARWTKLADTG